MATKRYSFVFYVAIIVAIGATYSVFRVLEATKASSRVATAPVVVASRDIRQGELIDRLAVQVAQWPVSTVPVGAYGQVDSVAGRVARVDVFSGEPVVPGRLAPEGTTAGIATKITPGKRAMSIRINDVSGVAGLIQPDSRVDILLTTSLSNTRTGKVFMSNMRVLGINATVQRTEDGRPIPGTSATLEVTPEEGEQLAVAMSQGQIQLMLRGYGDPNEVDTKGATTRDVERMLRNAPEVSLSPQRAIRPAVPRSALKPIAPETVVVTRPGAPAIAAKPESAKVEIFRGATKTELKFRKDSVKKDTTSRN